MIRYVSLVCQCISKNAAMNWVVFLTSAIGHDARHLERKALQVTSDMLCGTSWIQRYRELGRTGKDFEAAKLAGFAINTIGIWVTQKAVKLEEIF